MKRRRLLAGLIAALTLVTLPSIALAQATGSMTVTTVNELTGAPQGSVVCLEGPRDLCSNVAPDGVVRFNNLPVGDYSIVVQNIGESGSAQVTVRPDETSEVRLSVADVISPNVTAALASVVRRANDGSLASPTVAVRALLTNKTSEPTNAVQLHLTGPGGAALHDCYVSGQGDDPCRRDQNNMEAQWFVGAMPVNASRGPFIAEFTVGSGGLAGIAGFAWYSWQDSNDPNTYTATLGFNPSTTAATSGPAGILSVIPLTNGQPQPGVNVTAVGPASLTGITDASGRVDFVNAPVGTYSILAYSDAARGAATVSVQQGTGTLARLGYLSLPGISSPFADGPVVAGPPGPRLIADVVTTSQFTSADNRPVGVDSPTTVKVYNAPVYNAAGDDTTAIPVSDVSVTVTGPAATRFTSCTPDCTRVTVPDGSGVRFALGSLDSYETSAALTATVSAGSASAGNLGPNSVTVSWAENGVPQSYTINLGQGVPR